MHSCIFINKWFGLAIISTIINNAAICQTPRPVPSAYSSTVNKSYVRTWDAAAPEQTPNTLITRPLKDVKQATQYVDGLGRPLQTVIKEGSLETATGVKKDMVSAIEYDAFGREQFKYLAFPSTTSDGLFKINPFQQQATFMAAEYGSQNETFFYGQTVYEASPLNRVRETLAPGNSWVGNGRGVETQYWTNTDADLVKVWIVTNSGTAGTFGSYAVSSTNPEYDAGALYKTITTDESGKQVIEFKDKDGKVVLKKVQLTATADNGTGQAHGGWLCTYYMYDDLNNLRCVIQPAGVEIIKPAATWNWALTDPTILAEQCFRYEYDSRNRMIMKKVPGSAPVNMVYDSRDRLIMTQDGNMAVTPKKWMVTKYDVLNRPTETGLLTDANTAAYHQGAVGQSLSYPNTSSNYELLTQAFYDDYTLLTASGSSFTGSMTTSETTSGFLTVSNTSFPYPQPITQQTLNKGLVTGSKIKVIGSSPAQYLYTAIYYDDKNRAIQTKSTNITGGTDISTSQYSFDGKLLVNKLTHNKSGTNAQTHTIITTNTYDDAGRLTSISKKIDAMAAQSIVNNTYDELGQLITKQMASAFNGSTGLSNNTYDYNIRGWLLGLNRSQSLTTNTTSGRKFAYELGYDKTSTTAGENFTAAQYNGNIAGMIWKTSGDGTRRKYDFTYDAANRLMKADFEQNNGGTSTWNNTQVNYSVKMGDGTSAISAYDNNGNIKRMQQWGLKIAGSSQIDDLTYNYAPNTNKLLNVADAFNDNQTSLGDFRVSSLNPVQTKTLTTVDYSYDANGNMIKDLNKDLGKASANGVVYNHLNLPQTVTVYKAAGAVKGTITYTYDAAGNKLKKTTVEYGVTVPYNGSNYTSDITTTTTYIGPFVYESKDYSNVSLASLEYADVMQFASHEEGRIRRKSDGTFVYDYFIKDHLGSVRVVLTEDQQQDQYPAATLEGSTTAGATSMINYEKNFYTINNTYVVNSSIMPGWTTTKDYQNNNGNPPPNNSYPAGTTPTATAISSKVYKLNATTNKTGLAIVLKVMAGDKIDVHGKSYYQSSSTYNNANSTLLTLADVTSAFISSPDNAGLTDKGITSSILQTFNTGLVPVTFFRGNDNTSSNTPKAYINYLFFDEQFKYAGGNFSRVGSSGTVKNHWQDAQMQNISVPKNGYLYVYVSNESNDYVFFDNLQVIHTRGPMLEETHYYPFGLSMAGISSQAAGNKESKKRFQGQEFAHKEFSDGSGLEMYEFKYRMDDPQTGRFWQIDPLSNKYVYNSPYAFSENKVTGHIELEGLESVGVNDISNPALRALAKENVQRHVNDFNQNAKQSVEVKGSLGVGVGVTVKAGEKVNITGGVNGPQAEATVNGSGQVKANASVAGVGVEIKSPVAELKAGAKIGVVDYNNGNLTANYGTAGVGNPSLVKKVGDDDASQSLKANANGEVTLGAKIGIIGGEIKVNVVKAGNAVIDFFSAGYEYIKNRVSDAVKTPFNTDHQ